MPATTPDGNEDADAEVGNDIEDDEDLCFICASKIIHVSVSTCSHRTCHLCSLRMRALYQSKACLHCRVRFCRHSFQLAFPAHKPIDRVSVCDFHR